MVLLMKPPFFVANENTVDAQTKTTNTIWNVIIYFIHYGHDDDEQPVERRKKNKAKIAWKMERHEPYEI